MIYRVKTVSVVLGVLVAAAFPVVAAPPESPDARALLDTLAAHSGVNTPLYARVEVLHKGGWLGPDGQSVGSATRRRTWSDLYSDGKQVGVETRNYLGAEGDAQPGWQRERSVRLQGQWMRFAESDEGTGESAVRRFVQPANPNDPAPLHATWGMALLGMTPGSLDTMAATLSKGAEVHIRPEPEMVKDVPCVVVESISPDATWTAWLDPGADYLPRRLEGMVQVRGIAVAARYLARYQTTPPSSVSGNQPDSLVHTILLDDVFLGQTGDRHFLRRAAVRQRLNLADGAAYEVTDQLVLNQLHDGLHPGAWRFLMMADVPAPPREFDGATAAQAGNADLSFDYALDPNAPSAHAPYTPPAPGIGQRLARLWHTVIVGSLTEASPQTLLALSAVLALLVNLAVYLVSRNRAGQPKETRVSVWSGKGSGPRAAAGH